MIVELTIQEAIVRFARTDFERKLISYPFEFERTHFIDERNGVIVGRVSANLSLRDSTRGYIGMFDYQTSIDDSEQGASILIESAVRWLMNRGVKKIYGPVNYSTLFQYRFELPRDENEVAAPVFFWEPTQPEGFIKSFQNVGFTVAEEYHSRAYSNLQLILPKSQTRYEEALKSGFSTRPIDLASKPEHELKMLSKINAGSFDESFLAEPFDEKIYKALVAPQFIQYLSEFSFFILNQKGEEIGYFFLFPESDYLIWKTVAILPEYQGFGLAGFGIHHALMLAEKYSIKKVVCALIRKGAPSEVLLSRAVPFKIWEHRYAVFEKNCSN